MRCQIEPSALKGTLSIPRSKSQTMRALLFGLMAKGTTLVRCPLISPDTEAMVKAIEQLGAKVTRFKEGLAIEGVNAALHVADDVIDAANSGLVLRLISALAALLPSYTVLTGDASIRHRRLAKPLLEGLSLLGAFAKSARLDGYAPLIIKGPLKGGVARIDGVDSQPVSALLIASAFANKKTEIYVDHPGETPWVDLTLDWLKRLKLPYRREGYRYYAFEGGGRCKAFDYTVPADFSSCAYPLTAALLTPSSLTLTGLDFNDPQGDKALFPLLEAMGAVITTDGAKGTMSVSGAATLSGLAIDVNPIIDALPLLAVVGCYAKRETVLYNGQIARHKESDRIRSIVGELKKMGADIRERRDGLVVRSSLLRGAHLSAHFDHRIAMALTIAALFAKGTSTLDGVECIEKTYPHFIHSLQQLGARITIL